MSELLLLEGNFINGTNKPVFENQETKKLVLDFGYELFDKSQNFDFLDNSLEIVKDDLSYNMFEEEHSLINLIVDLSDYSNECELSSNKFIDFLVYLSESVSKLFVFIPVHKTRSHLVILGVLIASALPVYFLEPPFNLLSIGLLCPIANQIYSIYKNIKS